MFDYARKRSYISKPEKVARERDFYRLYKPDLYDYAIEKDLGALESELAPVLRHVTETDMASPKELGTLLSLAANIYVRGPRGLERAYLAIEEQMRSGLKDGTLTAEAWEEVRELLRLEGEDSAARVTYEEARRRLREDEAWSPIAPRDYIVAHLADLNKIILDKLIPDTPEDHVWSLAVANPDAGEFITSDSPLCWMSVLPWEPGHKKVESIETPGPGDSLDDPNTTVSFPLSKKLALITRPNDRGVKERGFRYEAIAEVVAWVNARTQQASLGTLYSPSEHFCLLEPGNKMGRSTDHFAHWGHLRRGAGLP